jgi:hypothetical protein
MPWDWKPVEKALTNALGLVRSQLNATGLTQAAEDVASFIYAGEYGLALEDLCEMLTMTHAPVSAEVYTLLEAAGEKMREYGAALDPSIWRALSPNPAPEQAQ